MVDYLISTPIAIKKKKNVLTARQFLSEFWFELVLDE